MKKTITGILLASLAVSAQAQAFDTEEECFDFAETLEYIASYRDIGFDRPLTLITLDDLGEAPMRGSVPPVRRASVDIYDQYASLNPQEIYKKYYDECVSSINN